MCKFSGNPSEILDPPLERRKGWRVGERRKEQQREGEKRREGGIEERKEEIQMAEGRNRW